MLHTRSRFTLLLERSSEMSLLRSWSTLFVEFIFLKSGVSHLEKSSLRTRDKQGPDLRVAPWWRAALQFWLFNMKKQTVIKIETKTKSSQHLNLNLRPETCYYKKFDKGFYRMTNRTQQLKLHLRCLWSHKAELICSETLQHNSLINETGEFTVYIWMQGICMTQKILIGVFTSRVKRERQD